MLPAATIRAKALSAGKSSSMVNSPHFGKYVFVVDGYFSDFQANTMTSFPKEKL
jgi:hypothetical protein